MMFKENKLYYICKYTPVELLEAYGAGGVLVGTDGSVKIVGLEESRVRLYHNEDGT